MDFNRGAQPIASKLNLKIEPPSEAAASEAFEKFPQDSDDTEAVLRDK